MVDYKLVIVDKLEKERWGENYVLWYKSNKFFLLWIWFLLKKEEMLMKYLFYNEGNLEGVKIEV